MQTPPPPRARTPSRLSTQGPCDGRVDEMNLRPVGSTGGVPHGEHGGPHDGRRYARGRVRVKSFLYAAYWTLIYVAVALGAWFVLHMEPTPTNRPAETDACAIDPSYCADLEGNPGDRFP